MDLDTKVKWINDHWGSKFWTDGTMMKVIPVKLLSLFDQVSNYYP